MSSTQRFHCGPFDLDGFATEPAVFPTAWKAALIFQGGAAFCMSLTVFCTLLTCCRQSVLGKSIHNCTGAAQAAAGIGGMLALFCYMLGWGAPRVLRVCGPDADAFYAAECTIGWSMWMAVGAVGLCFVCAVMSLRAESANMRSHVKRRIEGGERLVFVA